MATLATAALALYLLVGEPLLGRAAHRRMLAALGKGKPGVRLRFYLNWTWQGWLLMVVTLAITLGLAHWTPARMGLRLPDWPHLPVLLDRGAVGGFIAGAVIAALGGALLATLAHRRSPQDRRRPAWGASRNTALAPMLPRTPAERWGWAALSVTAGVTEEVIWRGFGLTLLFALLPGVHPALPIVLSAAAFGWAHWYQGLTGIVATGLLGGILALLFWVSGSLLLPIVLHALLDLPPSLARTSTVTGDQA